MDKPSENQKYDQLLEQIKNLQARLYRIEEYLHLGSVREKEIDTLQTAAPSEISDRDDALEFEIGQFWFTKVGIVILAMGVAFLLTFPYQQFPPVFPSLMGYFITAVIFSLSHYWRKSFTYLSRYLLGGGLVLLYFATLRLYFFSQQRAITNTTLELVLLIVVVAVNLVVSSRRESVYLAGLSVTMGYLTALVSNEPLFTLATITVVSIEVVYFQLKYRWDTLAIYGIAATYLTYVLWSLNDPILGNEVHLISSPQAGIYFILLYISIFAVGNLFRADTSREGWKVIIGTFFSSVGGYALYLLFTRVSFIDYFTFSHAVASILFLSLSVIFWLRERSRYATFFYSMLGYLALSVAIVYRFDLSNALVWLSWQSMLVITTALWFRSKYIVVANFFIYLIVLIAYLGLGSVMNLVSFSFGVAALLSARIMNAQQHRLELKTEMMRNAYLTAAFFFFPYALYQMVPREYVSLSWVGVAIVYYLLNLVLKKQKYRWMAILTLLLTVGYVFIVGILSLAPTYRMLSFLVLGIVMLVISMVYTRMRIKKSKSTEAPPI